MELSALRDEVLRSWRGLLRQPRYFLLATLTLALGIGAAIGVFSLLHRSLLAPLPFPSDGQLVTIGMDPGDGMHIASPAMFRELAGIEGIDSLGIVLGYTRTVNLAAEGSPSVGAMLTADRGFIETLGTTMHVGRNFAVDEDVPNGPRVALVTHAFWRDRFGADPGIEGATVQVEGLNVTVVGVLPEHFEWAEAFDLVVPMRVPVDSTDLDTNQYIVARAKGTMTTAELDARIDARVKAMLERRRAGIGPEAYDFLAGRTYGTRPLREHFVGGSRPVLWLFLGASLCVLLIAMINLTNLVLLRAVLRSHEAAVRSTLGATPLRLALPALGEGLLIGTAGSLGGLALAWFGLRVLGAFAPPDWLPGKALVLDPLMWPLALAVGLVLALVAAALGVWRGFSGGAAAELAGGGRSGISLGAGRLGRSLVVAQVAVAVVLLVAAGLFIRSLYELTSVPLGFETRSITTFSLSPVKSLYRDLDAVRRQTDDVIARLRQLPGSEIVSASSHLPVGSQLNLPVTFEDGRSAQPQVRIVTPGFFPVFGMDTVAGRLLAEGDDGGAGPVCVVSRSFAAQHFDGSAIGATLRLWRGADAEAGTAMRIVGVVDDVRSFGATEDAPPTVYVPMAQATDRMWAVVREYGPLRYAVRLRPGAGQPEAALRAAVAGVSPTQPIADLASMEAVVSRMTAANRLQLVLVGIFATLALLLASVGLYAVLSVTVASRRHEYGIRASLGARPRDLVRLTLHGAARQAGLGLALGLLATAALASTVDALFFGVAPWDPLALAGVVLVLMVTTLLAAIGPALRASRVDPAESLRGSG